MRAPPRRIFVAAQLLAAGIVLYFVGRALADQWAAFRHQPLEARLNWWHIGASGALVLGTHALLVQTWRLMIRAWGGGAELTFWGAARIWSVSSFGKYIPGKVWQISAMATMATRAGVSAVVSTGSALLGTIINIACGIGIVLVFGWQWLEQIRPEARVVAIVILALSLLGLVLLPFLVPRMNELVARITGRLIAFQPPPPRIITVAILGNLLAWATYGVAFMWLVSGMLGASAGAPWQYVAIYAASYVVGYLAFFLPGGIGAREAVMAVLMTSLGLATPKQALLVAGASRVWLTLLEIVPGVLFVARDVARRRTARNVPTDVPTQ